MYVCIYAYIYIHTKPIEVWVKCPCYTLWNYFLTHPTICFVSGHESFRISAFFCPQKKTSADTGRKKGMKKRCPASWHLKVQGGVAAKLLNSRDAA